MKRFMIGLFLVLALSAGSAARGRAENLIGGGVEYLRNLGDIKDKMPFDDNAFGIIGSFQCKLALLKLEADVEWLPNYGGTKKSLVQPQGYALIGGLIYGGAGIGIGNYDGEWESAPFYALRAGVDLELDGMDLDVYGVYRFQDAEMIEHLGKSDLDAITFCAVLRFSLGG